MSKDKISSQEMIDQVATSLSVSKRVAEEFLKSLFAEIEETLLKGEPVKIKNLGTFKMQWNEPRKSVNVQTGEVIVLDGYNKVIFTPDNELKDAVNEPYAHLDAIDLDESDQPVLDNIEAPKTAPELTDGLRNLSEQASEIKDLLSEINALSVKEKTPQPTIRNYEIPDYELILIDEDPEIVLIPEEDSYESEVIDEDKVDDKVDNDVDDDEQETNEVTNTAEETIEIQATLVDDSATKISPIEDTTIDEKITEQAALIAEDLQEPELKETIEVVKVFEEPHESINVEQELREEHTQEEEIAYKKESESEEPTYSPVYEQVPQTTYKSSNTELKEAVSSPFILGKTKKKRRGLKFIFIFILLTGLTAGGVYIAYASSSCFSCWFKYTLLSEENRDKADKYWTDVKGWFDFSDKKVKVEAPKTEVKTDLALTDSAIAENPTLDTETEALLATDKATVQAPDSFDIAFKNRRNYTEFIGEETISEGTRLTTVSQQYYGKREFWVYIYEANRDNIVHPDRITPGTVVKVPKVDPRLIDKKNPKCLQKARELHDLYVGKK